MDYAFAIPIPAGKTEQFRRAFQELMGPRRAGYDDFQRRQGVQEETYFLQSTPEGDVFIIAGRGQLRPFSAVVDLANPFDQWFRQVNQDIFGFDIAELAGPPTEVLGEWRAT